MIYMNMSSKSKNLIAIISNKAVVNSGDMIF